MKTTVFCAAYSKDPNREALLKVHLNNLLSQTVPVEPIYVFEASDPVASTLTGVRTFVANYPMTIYESWNLAVAMARTDYVMNLNLDDRLNQDAVELLQNRLEQEKADLVGGDWRICFTQEDTDKVLASSPGVETVPFYSDWPPVAGRPVRLGSGTGQRGTYGPATLWRASAHMNCPRYPYRTTDGYLIKSVGDAVWWTYLRNKNKKLVRVPNIIGHYFSHPGEQAEFRTNVDAMKLRGAGVVVF